MKVLQLCNKPPFPTVDGGTIAMHALTRGLLDAGHTVKVISIETSKHPFKVDRLTDEYKQQTNAEAVFVDTRIKPLLLLTSFLLGELYIMERFISDKFKKRLIQLLEQESFDVVLLESLYVTPYIDTIRRYSKVKIILRAHNVEYLIWQRLAEKERNPVKAYYLKSMAKQLQRYEQWAFSAVDGVAAISSIDTQTISYITPGVKVKTINLSTEYKHLPLDAIEPNTLFHLGSMDWMPNVEGIIWLIEEVWPLVVAKQPNAKLYLAGRNMPKSIINRAATNIIVEGAIDSPTEYIATKQIMVVPLFAGSGVRVKIIEGMAFGKPIVATTIAVEGIGISNGNNAVITDSAIQFADAIVYLLQHPDKAKELGDNAADFIEQNYRTNVVIKKLESFIASI
jgi:glycosyltransferase involved in cell wall biosynthesis